MPTPFMHLQLAEAMRARARENGKVRLCEVLDCEWPAFYLGSVAADFQTIADIPRAETHFYELPPEPDDEAVPLMFKTYPELANGPALPQAQAVFVAAYCAHLYLDLLWFRRILIPYFVQAKRWGDRSQRHLAHNLLLAYLDRLAFDSLPTGAAETLAVARPRRWLPFASDGDLVRWRDMLVSQLRPGATLETVKIYAQRLQMRPDEFDSKLRDDSWIEEQVFAHVPLPEVQAILNGAVPDCVTLVADYLALSTSGVPLPGDRSS